MPEPENPKPRRAPKNETAQEPQELPRCHIHEKVEKDKVDQGFLIKN